MISFTCDYAEGAHERVLQRLMETNREQTLGYGEDVYCAQARNYIQTLCEDDRLDVHFLVGGTQSNAAVITAALRPYQSVIAPSSGHINIHETGAVESYGHKVLPIPSTDGKITAAQIQTLYDDHWNDVTHEHMVQPGMVYLSQPTETGTLYSKAELTAIWETCQTCGLTLFIDGARLGYGLMSESCDLTLPQLAHLCDVFSIGGTKQGMLFGEAVVISQEALKRDFRYIIKQHGAMLAKGRLLGLQFCAMLEDGLYFDLSRQADRLAMMLRRAFEARGYPMYFDSYTNQQFPTLPDSVLEKLAQEFEFAFWTKADAAHSVVRVCTSWATEETAAEALIAALDRCRNETSDQR